MADTTNKLPESCDQDSANCTCFTSTNGSTECGCSPGYKLDGTFSDICQGEINWNLICRQWNLIIITIMHIHADIDECKDDRNLCHNGTCKNNDGSFDCFCPPGYIFDSSGKLCIGQLTFTMQLCILIPRPYSQPFNGAHWNIEKIGEPGDKASSYVFYLIHSYLYELSVDLDECTLGVHDCDNNAVCSNYGGGYNCSCKRDYFGDGKSCFR